MAPRSTNPSSTNDNDYVDRGSRDYWNVYFILSYVGFGVAVFSTFLLLIDLLLRLLIQPVVSSEPEDPLIQPSGIEFDKQRQHPVRLD